MPQRNRDSISIMIVDDSTLTRRKISQVLCESGYKSIIETNDGEKALETIKDTTPDLFLIDVLMPGISGTELCRQIRQIERFADTPILIVTGDTSEKTRLEGFKSGAQDYIPKPFHPMELLSRVNSQLDLYLKSKANEIYAKEMETLAEELAHQMLKSEKLSTLGSLMAGIVHEIRNAIGCVDGNAQFLEKLTPELENMGQYAFEHGMEKNTKRELAIESLAESTKAIREGVHRTMKIVENVLHFSKKASGKIKSVDLAEIMQEALTVAHNKLKYHVKVENNIPNDLPPVKIPPESLIQVLVNLLINGADATEGTPGAYIKIDAVMSDSTVKCTIADNGCGMDEETLNRLWEPFYTTKANGNGLGMGLSKQILENAGGGIQVESTKGEGTSVTISLSTV